MAGSLGNVETIARRSAKAIESGWIVNNLWRLLVTTSSLVTMMFPSEGHAGAIIVALPASELIGPVKGMLVARGRLSGIVLALGRSFVRGGPDLYIAAAINSRSITNRKGFSTLGRVRSGCIAASVHIMLAMAVVAHLLSTRTRAGHYIIAVGETLWRPLFGYQGLLLLIFAFVLSGIGGVLLATIQSSAQPVGGQGYSPESFAVVYLVVTVYGKGKAIFSTR